MNREDYLEDLKRRQKEHLEKVKTNNFGYNHQLKSCAHDQCPRCLGTGVDSLGRMCIHNLHCNCPKCSITF